MLTIESIKTEFSLIKAKTGNSECYQNTDETLGHGDFCDVYFNSNNETLLQSQVDIFNDFKKNHNKYSPEIEKYILNNLDARQQRQIEKIRDAVLFFDVVVIPQETTKYDMVLVCSKSYKYLMFFDKNICVRIEFKDKKIQSIKITKDTTVDNN